VSLTPLTPDMRVAAQRELKDALEHVRAYGDVQSLNAMRAYLSSIAVIYQLNAVESGDERWRIAFKQITEIQRAISPLGGCDGVIC
jgi:hypothetical protein